jgi:hypothetical protein
VLARFGVRDVTVEALEVTRQSRHPTYEYVESGYLLASAWVAAAGGGVTEGRKLSGEAADNVRLRRLLQLSERSPWSAVPGTSSWRGMTVHRRADRSLSRITCGPQLVPTVTCGSTGKYGALSLGRMLRASGSVCGRRWGSISSSMMSTVWRTGSAA